MLTRTACACNITSTWKRQSFTATVIIWEIPLKIKSYNLIENCRWNFQLFTMLRSPESSVYFKVGEARTRLKSQNENTYQYNGACTMQIYGWLILFTGYNQLSTSSAWICLIQSHLHMLEEGRIIEGDRCANRANTHCLTCGESSIALTVAILWTRLVVVSQGNQLGIINCKGTETFAKEPKLANLLWELKKVHWFLSYVCNGKFAAFWVLFCRINCKWVLFPSIDL